MNLDLDPVDGPPPSPPNHATSTLLSPPHHPLHSSRSSNIQSIEDDVERGKKKKPDENARSRMKGWVGLMLGLSWMTCGCLVGCLVGCIVGCRVGSRL